MLIDNTVYYNHSGLNLHAFHLHVVVLLLFSYFKFLIPFPVILLGL